MEAVGAYVYKDTFDGVAEELCGRTSGKVGIWGHATVYGAYTEKQKPRIVGGRGGDGSGGGGGEAGDMEDDGRH